MSKEERAEKLREAIVRRKMERANPETTEELESSEGVNFEELLAPVESFAEEELPEFLGDESWAYEQEEEYPVSSAFEAQVAYVQESGFDAYLEGKVLEDNPFNEELMEELSEEEVEVLSQGWESGWFEAHREAWTAELIIAAKHLVECNDPDDAGKFVDRMEQALSVLESVMDFEAYEDFWGFEG
jgi:hypothetical protein